MSKQDLNEVRDRSSQAGLVILAVFVIGLAVAILMAAGGLGAALGG